jgi:hypothetical protein
MCRYGRTSGPRSLSFGLGVLSGTFCANSPLRSRLNMGTGTPRYDAAPTGAANPARKRRSLYLRLAADGGANSPLGETACRNQ